MLQVGRSNLVHDDQQRGSSARAAERRFPILYGPFRLLCLRDTLYLHFFVVFQYVILSSHLLLFCTTKLFTTCRASSIMATSTRHAKDENEKNPPTTTVNDMEKQANNLRIVWDDVEVDRGERGRVHGRSARRRSRSQSRDSISSIRSRTQSVSGIPIGFRTLSIQVSESQAKASEPPLKHTKTTDSENKDYFEQLDYHT